MELEEEMREAEMEHEKLRGQIQKVEFKLSEQRKVFSNTYRILENDDSCPISPKNGVKEVIETPKASKKCIKRNLLNSVPRFMTSTVASRQRQSAAERDIVGRSRSLRSVVPRGSIQFSGSQSLSCSDLRLKAILQSSTGKSRLGETNIVVTESPKCNGLELKTTNPRSNMVTSSDPNLRVTLCRHRRRMSDLI